MAAHDKSAHSLLVLLAGMASSPFLAAAAAQARPPSRQGPSRARSTRPSSAGAGGSSFCAESGECGYDSDCGSDGGDDLMDCDGGNGSGGMAKGKTIELSELQQVRAESWLAASRSMRAPGPCPMHRCTPAHSPAVSVHTVATHSTLPPSKPWQHQA